MIHRKDLAHISPGSNIPYAVNAIIEITKGRR